MAGGLRFGGTAGAKAEGLVLRHEAPAVELSILPGPGPAVLVSMARDGRVGRMVFLRDVVVLRLDGEGQLWVDHYSEKRLPPSKTLTRLRFEKVPIDGADWHHVSLYLPKGWDGQQVDMKLYVDGKLLGVAESRAESSPAVGVKEAEIGPEPQAPQGLFSATQTGSVMFGADGFLEPARAPAFTGAMGELRVWGGGDPDWILEPAFALNVGVPVSKTAKHLQAYWPMWETSDTPLKDVTGAMDLKPGPSVQAVTGLRPLYDDMSDLQANGRRAAFAPFTASGHGAAFGAVMKQLGIQHTPETFRALYPRQENADTLNLYGSWLKGFAYREASDHSADDFEQVKTTLLDELLGLSQLWGYYKRAMEDVPLVTQQFESAAQTVIRKAENMALREDLRGALLREEKEATLSVTTVLDGISSLASSAGTPGKVVGGALKGILTVVKWATPPPKEPPDLSRTLTMTSKASQLKEKATELSVKLRQDLHDSVTRVACDGGLLLEVARRITKGDSFQLRGDLPSQAQIDQIYQSVLIFMTRALLQSRFTFWVLKKALVLPVGPMGAGGSGTASGERPAIRVPLVNHSLFGLQFGPRENPLGESRSFADLIGLDAGGAVIVGYYEENGYNGYPTYHSLAADFAQLLNEAAVKLSGHEFARSELFSWFAPVRLTYA